MGNTTQMSAQWGQRNDRQGRRTTGCFCVPFPAFLLTLLAIFPVVVVLPDPGDPATPIKNCFEGFLRQKSMLKSFGQFSCCQTSLRWPNMA